MSRHLARKRIAAMILIVLVVVSGFALAQSGNISNPFRVFSQITALVSSTSANSASEGAARTEGQPPSEATGNMPEGGHPQGGERGDQTSNQWSRLGSVLFNLWFITATTAVVMIVGRPLGILLKPLRQRTASIHMEAVS